MAIIQVNNLSFTYPSYHPETSGTTVLRDISLAIDKGEVFAVMGPTGAGKTTLCLTLNGIIPHLAGGEMTGSVIVAGCDTRITHPSGLAGIVGMVYQDPEYQLFCPTVEEEVAFGLENLGLSVGEISERVTWALHVAGMFDCRAMPPSRLSGGQKQRVAIACSLAMLPEVLILDEPTSSLDPAGQMDVMTAVERLRRERQMTLVMVSNDAEQVIQIADRVAFIVDGQVVSQGIPHELLFKQELLKMAGISPSQMVELSWEFNAHYQSDYRWFVDEHAESDLRARLEATR